LKDDVFTSTLGKDFIPFAFNTAKAANPHPLLSLSENDVEGYHAKGLSAKYQGLYDLVKDLKSKGVHIDVVSFESHFITGEVPKVRSICMEILSL
jgi:endo-1,4-beta-xylanase